MVQPPKKGDASYELFASEKQVRRCYPGRCSLACASYQPAARYRWPAQDRVIARLWHNRWPAPKLVWRWPFLSCRVHLTLRRLYSIA